MTVKKYNPFEFDETFLRRLKAYCDECRILNNCRTCMFIRDEGDTKTCKFKNLDEWCEFYGITGAENEKVKLGFSRPMEV